MKKLLLILLLLLIPCIAFSQIFDLGADVGFGYLTEWESFITNIDIAIYINPNGLLSGVAYGGVEVLMENGVRFGMPVTTFLPYSDRYSIGGALNLNLLDITLYVSFTHYCLHPVWSGWNQFFEKAYAENSTKFMVGMNHNWPYKVNRRGK